MAETRIKWTDATWNPVTGCTKVGAGCDNCYAAQITPYMTKEELSSISKSADQILDDFKLEFNI